MHTSMLASDIFSHVSKTEALTVLAYVLLLTATVPVLAQYESAQSGFAWAMIPVCLVLTGYTASIMKAVAPEKDDAKRFDHVVWLTWTTFYTLSLIWPLPLHWYDVLAITALIAQRDNALGASLLALYYLLSAHTYMGKGDALQVCGRLILLGVMSSSAYSFALAPEPPQT